MKQIYAFSLALLAASYTALSADATNLNFVCEKHSEEVQVVTSVWDYDTGESSSETYDLDSEGKLTLVRNSDASYVVKLKSGSEYVLANVTTDCDNAYTYSSGGGTAVSFYGTLPDDIQINIDVRTEAELYPDTFYLTVDDPSQASISIYGSKYRTLDMSGFEAGVEKAVAFDASVSNTLYIYNTDYTKGFYKVYKNGEEATYDYGMDIAADDHISVEYKYPDTPVRVNITYATEESRGCITSVTVDGVAISDYEDGFDAKLGQSVEMDGDVDAWNYEYFKIDGVNDYWSKWYASSTFTLKADVEIEVSATKFAELNYTVNIDNPDNVIMYSNYYYYGNTIALEAGENNLSISSNSPVVSFTANSGCSISSIKDGDGTEYYEGDKYTTITITEGMVLNVSTASFVRDKSFVLYIDDPTLSTDGNFLKRADGSHLVDNMEYPAGYSQYAFYDGDNDFSFLFYGAPDPHLYINDEEQESDYADRYQFGLSDNDVVKAYLNGVPASYNVTFDVVEGATVTATKDLVKAVSAEGFSTFAGTQVDLTISGDDHYAVTINGEEIKSAGGVYSFEVTEDTAVKVTTGEAPKIIFNCPNHSEDTYVFQRKYDYTTWTQVVIGEYEFDENGRLELPYTQGATTYVAIKDGVSGLLIDEITTSDADNTYTYKSNGDQEYAVIIYQEPTEDLTVNVTVLSEEEKYSDVFYLKIDDPTQASLMFAETYREIHTSAFEADVERTVLFDASSERTIYIHNDINSQKGYYKVFLNDEDCGELTNDALSVAVNDHVYIQYQYPEELIHVSFVYADEASRGCITGVTVDNVELTDFEDGFDANIGSWVSIEGDKTLYNYTQFDINGESQFSWGYIYFPKAFLLKEETTVEVAATPYGQINVTLNIEHPEHVTVYKGGYWNANILKLESGENHITVSESDGYLSFEAKSGCFIDSILDADGNELYVPSDYSASTVNVSEGMVLTVYTHAIDRDKSFVLYIDDPAGAVYGMGLMRGDYSDLDEDSEYSAGYTVYDFADEDNDFMFSFYSPVANNVYINDVKQDPYYSGGSSYKLTLADKDVVKCFLAADPETFNVSFEVAEGIDLQAVKDLVAEADVISGFTALTGTQVDVQIVNDGKYAVTVNDEQVATENNAFTFNVNADTVVKIAVDDENGVGSVNLDAIQGDVYNLQGLCILRDATRADVKKLPAGVYIFNHVKVVVK